MIAGSSSLPQSDTGELLRSKPVPGWKEHVEEHRQRAIFWQSMWKQCGSPRQETVADIRKSSRIKYHYAIRFARKQSEITRGNKVAEAMSNKRSVDFWNEIKKIKGTHKAMPGMVDGTQAEGKISQIFSRKYDRLNNSVSYDETDMSLLQDDTFKSVSTVFANVVLV